MREMSKLGWLIGLVKHAKKTVILIVIHHRQNPLESRFTHCLIDSFPGSRGKMSCGHERI
jgi:hypothetical protein